MKITKSRLSVCCIIFFIIVFSAGFKNNAPAPEQLIKKTFLQNIDSFEQAVLDLKTFITASPETENNIRQAEELFFTMRAKYKNIEFLCTALDAEFAENLNGGNVVHGDENILSTAEIQPRGMQVIESLLFSNHVQDNNQVVAGLCQQLIADINIFKQEAAQFPFSTTMIIDACRKEVMRVCFMGITGFDSPVAKNSIPEAIVSLRSIKNAVLQYTTLLDNDPVFKKVILDNLDAASDYLQVNNTFDSFDRLYFTRQFGNILYSQLLELHIKSGSPFPDALRNANTPLRYSAGNLFAADLLNPLFYSPDKNEHMHAEQIHLGRMLFFDPVLSVNNKRACASCHQPAKAFTDGLTKSTSFDFNGNVKRNAPTLINAIFQGKYFYDERAGFPETQIDHVVLNALEFNSGYEMIIQKLQQSPEYVTAFQHAFPEMKENTISNFTITKAISDYVRSLVALNSEFDRYMRNEQRIISENVRSGYNLFMGKAQCGTCHFAPTFYGTVPPEFTESETEVIGVPATDDTLKTSIDPDMGRYDIQNVPAYRHAFKTQTVRNIELTAPYMHNGVFSTLEQVLDFYNRGGAAGLQIDLQNQTLAPDKLELTKSEIQDIIAFMRSLTDTSGTTDIPETLPVFPSNASLNERKIGGEY